MESKLGGWSDPKAATPEIQVFCDNVSYTLFYLKQCIFCTNLHMLSYSRPLDCTRK